MELVVTTENLTLNKLFPLFYLHKCIFCSKCMMISAFRHCRLKNNYKFMVIVNGCDGTKLKNKIYYDT